MKLMVLAVAGFAIGTFGCAGGFKPINDTLNRESINFPTERTNILKPSEPWTHDQWIKHLDALCKSRINYLAIKSEDSVRLFKSVATYVNIALAALGSGGAITVSLSARSSPDVTYGVGIASAVVGLASATLSSMMSDKQNEADKKLRTKTSAIESQLNAYKELCVQGGPGCDVRIRNLEKACDSSS